MLTVDEARSVFEQYVREHPLPLEGTLHLDGWLEDADDFLPIWGAREFSIDGDTTYNRMDNLVVFIDKRSGAVRRTDRFVNFDKVKKMTRVASS